MDATTPFRRRTRLAALLVLAAGCHTAAKTAAPIERGQLPADIPGPIAPVAGAPVTPAVVSGPAVPEQPVSGRAVAASYSPAGNADKMKLPGGAPRIKVVAVVGAGNIVTDQEVWEAVHQRMGEYVSQVDGPSGGKQVVRNDAREKAVYGEELRRTIERELVLDEMYARLKKAGKMNVVEEIKEFSGKGADRTLREMRKSWRVESDDDFRAILTSQGLTAPVIRRQIERQSMAEEYVRSMMKEKGIRVGLGDIRTYYDAHPDDFRTPDKVKWLHIFISTNKFPNARAAYDHALALQQKATAGADFVALSKEHDHGYASRQNGEGTGTDRGKIEPADLEPAVWALKPGQVSELLETPVGYHIVKVVEREVSGIRPFDDKTQTAIRRVLLARLQQAEHRKLVEDLWRRGVVKVIEE